MDEWDFRQLLSAVRNELKAFIDVIQPVSAEKKVVVPIVAGHPLHSAIVAIEACLPKRTLPPTIQPKWSQLLTASRSAGANADDVVQHALNFEQSLAPDVEEVLIAAVVYDNHDYWYGGHPGIFWNQWVEQLEGRGKVDAPHPSKAPMQVNPTSKNEPIKRPSDRALQAWRLRDLKRIKTQQGLADKMTEFGVLATQGEVSRWLAEVEKYREAGNSPPSIKPLSAEPSSMDPKKIDLGRRQDGRTPRQRERRDADSDEI